MSFERGAANLDNLPLEIVIKYLLPKIGACGLKNLSLVHSKWRETVQTFVRSFNTIVDLSKPSQCYLLTFMTFKAVNLVTLNLEGCYNSPHDTKLPEDLENIILSNKNLLEIYIPNTWISPEVVNALARGSNKLRVIKLSSFKLRLYDLEDNHHNNGSETGSGSRKLWPCSCWGTKLEKEEELESLTHSYATHLFNQNEETVEKRLLNNLRLLEQNTNFQDVAWQCMEETSEHEKNWMDPLKYHEYKCRKGLFYDGNNDQDDFFLDQVAHIFEISDSSDTTDYDE